MEQYKKIAYAVRNHFRWYAENEGIELDETEVISDFLRYWFNDGISFIASNQADQLFFKQGKDPNKVDWRWYEEEYRQNPEDYYDSIKYDETAKYGFKKIPAKYKLTPEQKDTVDYYSIYNRICNECDWSINYIVRHYKELTEFGFIKDSGNSLFGFPIWKNQNKQPLNLYQRILRFSLVENVYNLKTFAKKELKAMGLNERGEPIEEKTKTKPAKTK